MNTASATKLVSFLSRLAAVGLATFLAAFVLDLHALACFAFASSALILLVAAADYAPRPASAVRRAGVLVDFAPAPARISGVEKLAA